MTLGRKFYRKLQQIVGPEAVCLDKECLISYSYDASFQPEATPDIVVHPASLSEVVAIVKAAASERVPIVPRGAGTGLTGGSLAIRGGIVLHFDRMSRIKVLNQRDLYAIVEPGVINHDLKKAAAGEDLFYPPDPGSMKVCTLGGNVAENAGGPLGVKYGVTADYVLGLEAVLSTGEVIRTGGITKRNVAGYDVSSLLVGSEGTLAVITEITMKLLPKPRASHTILFAFNGVAAAGEAVVAFSVEGIQPAALEIMDPTALAGVRHLSPNLGIKEGESILLMELDGEPEGVRALAQRAEYLCLKEGARIVGKAEGEDQAEPLWQVRRSVSAALGRRGPSKIGEDISVPRGKVPEMIRRIQNISRRQEVPIAVFGHAGDGNLHPNILFDIRNRDMMARVNAAISDLFEAAIDLGGTISGEHGIGTTKTPWLPKAVTAETISMMKKIKQALDPAGIMNPGKIFES